MKLYRVEMPWHEDDESCGVTFSPFFKSRKDAEHFLELLKNYDEDDIDFCWKTFDFENDVVLTAKDAALIVEYEVGKACDECVTLNKIMER